MIYLEQSQNFWQAPISLEYTIQCLIQTSPTLVSVLICVINQHVIALYLALAMHAVHNLSITLPCIAKEV